MRRSGRLVPLLAIPMALGLATPALAGKQSLLCPINKLDPGSPERCRTECREILEADGCGIRPETPVHCDPQPGALGPGWSCSAEVPDCETPTVNPDGSRRSCPPGFALVRGSRRKVISTQARCKRGGHAEALPCEGLQPKACWEKGLALTKAGRHREADPLLNELCERGFERACVESGVVAVRLGERNRAISLLKAPCDAGNIVACQGLGAVFVQLGRVDEALKCFDRACGNGPVSSVPCQTAKQVRALKNKGSGSLHPED